MQTLSILASLPQDFKGETLISHGFTLFNLAKLRLERPPVTLPPMGQGAEKVVAAIARFDETLTPNRRPIAADGAAGGVQN